MYEIITEFTMREKAHKKMFESVCLLTHDWD